MLLGSQAFPHFQEGQFSKACDISSDLSELDLRLNMREVEAVAWSKVQVEQSLA